MTTLATRFGAFLAKKALPWVAQVAASGALWAIIDQQLRKNLFGELKTFASDPANVPDASQRQQVLDDLTTLETFFPKLQGADPSNPSVKANMDAYNAAAARLKQNGFDDEDLAKAIAGERNAAIAGSGSASLFPGIVDAYDTDGDGQYTPKEFATMASDLRNVAAAFGQSRGDTINTVEALKRMLTVTDIKGTFGSLSKIFS